MEVELFSAEELRRTLNRLTTQIIEATPRLTELCLLGIYTRGVPLAERLARNIQQWEGVVVPVGSLDITFYRDDLDRIGARTPAPTQIPFDITSRAVVLVDDVIYSGRTVRAALEAIKDHGRPQVVRLAVLVDRGHRELPIHPDFTGKIVPTSRDEMVRVYLMETDQRDQVLLVKTQKSAA
ncbi:MAG: bifunctional pyr operon transcriptional regulator/uracil phosphoribosyltransferase PyrR [Gloeomargarita sp. SKYB31]|nr:bifunctional pyr operon transcriptional regulator/uracil phosphoribosyltransferase PyrR [Gloeomargarita sp. SKYB31]